MTATKYKVGDLIYDTSYECLGIITDVKEFDFPRREDEGDRWGYYLNGLRMLDCLSLNTSIRLAEMKTKTY